MMTDPGIILFGKKIGLPETPKTTDPPPFAAANSDDGLLMDKMCETIDRHEHRPVTQHDQRKDECKPDEELDDNPKTPSIDEEGMSENNQTSGIDGDPMNLQPRTLKKPDKILPCPRCESMNTKFCYYNNSNINQPRHFCKTCQRYWTAGGTMRSMPVGAGRRKKKSQPSDCRFIITQEAFESAAAANHIAFAADSDVVQPKVLSFGQNSPHFGARLSSRENGDACTSGSTVIASNPVVEKTQSNNGFQPQVHWIPGGPWSYNPWNTGMPIPMPIPTVCPPGYPPMPIYHSPYWSSVSWLPPSGSILGKHSTDEEARRPNESHEEPKKQKSSVLTPKTLRIDDPDDAAKSSIWATLGIKNENSGRGDLFKAFQAKGDEKKKQTATEPSAAYQANPAAFSRSLCFQERA